MLVRPTDRSFRWLGHSRWTFVNGTGTLNISDVVLQYQRDI